MKSFIRIFRYILPQWPRVLVVISAAMLMGLLFSLNIVTIIPLLKVMMGEEGLHGWVDRQICNRLYGIDFYVPDMTDVIGSKDGQIAYYLLVTDIKKNSPAGEAGLQEGDRIIGVGDLLNDGGEDSRQIPAGRLLESLATTSAGARLKIAYRRIDRQGRMADNYSPTTLVAPANETTEKKIMWAVVNNVQRLVSSVPREESRATRARVVMFIALMALAVTALRCAMKFFQTYTGEKVVQIAVARLREDVFAHVMRMPVGFFSKKGTSDTTSRIIGDTSIVGNGAKTLLGKTLREPIIAAWAIVCAMMINRRLTLIFLASTPAVIFVFGFLGRKIRKTMKKLLVNSARILGRVHDAIGALRVVKVYNRQDYEARQYRQLNRTLLKRMLQVSRLDSALNPTMEVLGMIAGSAALVVGAQMVSSGQVDTSSFLALLLLLGISAEAIRKVSDVWGTIQQSNAAAERVFAIIDEAEEHEQADAADIAPMRKEIVFDDIYFTYPGNNQPTLKGVNLTVKAGQTVAVVGPNGSGKTTLINLIPRFYDPDRGRVLIDGVDIRSATLRSLRYQIGMVTQNVVTFNDTIAANISYGKADATQEEIADAAKRSYCHEFIVPLQKGYDTVIGEHGAGFSGGQLQRLVIARAIIKNPPILIFDEATSQIDADSEAKIHTALSDLMQNRTCFIIAHRFSTVIKADSIVVMDQGRIIAHGSHEQLTRECKLYRNLYETQLITP